MENYEEMLEYFESEFNFRFGVNSSTNSQNSDVLFSCNGCFTMFEDASRLLLLIKTVKGQLSEVVLRMKGISEGKGIETVNRKRKQKMFPVATTKLSANGKRMDLNAESLRNEDELIDEGKKAYLRETFLCIRKFTTKPRGLQVIRKVMQDFFFITVTNNANKDVPALPNCPEVTVEDFKWDFEAEESL
jgi:hypothetical protein